jgi:hypothetical protein
MYGEIKMKRFILICIVVGLFAGHAYASLYQMDITTASQLRDVSWSDNQIFGGNLLKYVGLQPGDSTVTPLYGAGVYGALNPMYYSVGFVGDLTDNTGTSSSLPDGFASVLIGAAGTPALTTINSLSGSLTTFTMPISNDNDDFWEYKLYVVDALDQTYETGWIPISSGNQLTLSVGAGGVSFSDIKDIGFGVQLNVASQGATSDDFHTSIVPVPAAVILGILGIGVAGFKLRKHA